MANRAQAKPSRRTDKLLAPPCKHAVAHTFACERKHSVWGPRAAKDSHGANESGRFHRASPVSGIDSYSCALSAATPRGIPKPARLFDRVCLLCLHARVRAFVAVIRVSVSVLEMLNRCRCPLLIDACPPACE